MSGFHRMLKQLMQERRSDINDMIQNTRCRLCSLRIAQQLMSQIGSPVEYLMSTGNVSL